MAIEAQFKSGKIKVAVDAYREKIHGAAIAFLSYLGEKLISYARERHNYTDQTGNLTNSIGYAVLHNKRIVKSGGMSGSVSKSSSMNIINRMSTSGSNQYSLIIVAGMNYAAYVEAKGYNVILPAELKARKDFPAAMNRFFQSAKKKGLI
jgi:flagellar basal body rod protein FlgG